jgi:hypothetical protein
MPIAQITSIALLAAILTGCSRQPQAVEPNRPPTLTPETDAGVEILRAVLGEEGSHTFSPNIRETDLGRLVLARGATFLPTYRETLSTLRHSKDPKQMRILFGSISAIAVLSDKASIELLRSVAADGEVDPEVRIRAIESLVSLGAPVSDLYDIELRRETNPRRRVGLLGRISRRGDPASLPGLRSALGNERDEAVRKTIEQIIALLEHPETCLLNGPPRSGPCNYSCAGEPGIVGTWHEAPNLCPPTISRPDAGSNP